MLEDSFFWATHVPGDSQNAEVFGLRINEKSSRNSFFSFFNLWFNFTWNDRSKCWIVIWNT